MKQGVALSVSPIHLVALSCAVLLLSGCAAIFRGTTQLIPITSSPVGAEVIVNGELVGRTPLEVELGRGGEHAITLRWNGQERSFTLYSQSDNEAAGLLVADAVPGGVLIGLGAVNLISCRSSASPREFDFSELCRGLSLGIIGIGATAVAIPVGIDTTTGAVMQLSPSEIFVAFE